MNIQLALHEEYVNELKGMLYERATVCGYCNFHAITTRSLNLHTVILLTLHTENRYTFYKFSQFYKHLYINLLNICKLLDGQGPHDNPHKDYPPSSEDDEPEPTAASHAEPAAASASDERPSKLAFY